MREVIDLIKTLIRFKSVHSNPEGIIDCADFLEDYIKKLNVEYQRYDNKGTPSLLVMPSDQKVPVLLMSHFDVVEGSNDLFQPFEHNGAVYGRGALDDKYAVAISLLLLKNTLFEYRKRGLDLDNLPFGILLTGDEEKGGEDGANHVLSKIQTDYCIALDGGNVNEVVIKEKGIVQIKLIGKGITTHSSRPWLGKNAIDVIISDYHILKTFFDEAEIDNWHRTMNLAKINAGSSYNQVPGHAEAILDIRFTENDNMDELLVQMKKAIQGEIVVLKKEPLFQGKKSMYLDLIVNANPSVKLASEHGSSDARFLSNYGFDGAVWGANGNLSHHSENEHVEIESVVELYNRLDTFLQHCSEMD